MFNCMFILTESGMMDSEGNVTYKFNGCYKTIFEHRIEYEKEMPIKNLTRA